jgi:hypothetical protein
VLLHDFIAKLQVLQEFIADPIEEFIFKPMIRLKFGEDMENAHIMWKPIIEEDKNMRSQRLIQLLQAGAISVNECRMEMGFKRIGKSKYDQLVSAEPAGFSNGFPPKPSVGVPQEQKSGPDVSRKTQQSVTPPESHMKLENIKAKKIELLKLDDQFREEMFGLAQKTKFDLKDDAKLVKTVRKEAIDTAKEIVSKYGLASYLISRFNTNTLIAIEDDLTFTSEESKNLVKCENNLLNEFEKIFSGMIVDKENGVLI